MDRRFLTGLFYSTKNSIEYFIFRSETADLEPLRGLPLLEELRLKGLSGVTICSSLEPLLSTHLRHLVRKLKAF